MICFALPAIYRTFAIYHITFIQLKTMAYTRITAAEGAAMIEDGATIGFSGFTPNGIPKAVIREIKRKQKLFMPKESPIR